MITQNLRSCQDLFVPAWIILLLCFSHWQNSICLLNNTCMCRSSWESNELLFFASKRLFSQSVSVLFLRHLLFLCSCATSHSFPLGADGVCYYPPTMRLRVVLLFYLRHSVDDDYRRLIVYGCERKAVWERERERKRKKRNKHTHTPNIAVHRLKEEESSVRPLPSPTVSKCCSHACIAKIFSSF